MLTDMEQNSHILTGLQQLHEHRHYCLIISAQFFDRAEAAGS